MTGVQVQVGPTGEQVRRALRFCDNGYAVGGIVLVSAILWILAAILTAATGWEHAPTWVVVVGNISTLETGAVIAGAGIRAGVKLIRGDYKW